MLVLGVTAFASLAGPRIEIADAVWNFGTVTNAAELTHAFTLRNSGDADLEITGTKSGCDNCLRVRLETPRVTPGGTATLHCRLDLRGLDGPVSRTVTLESNDPERPVVLLELTGAAVACYQISPPQPVLDLSQGQRAVTVEIEALQPLRAPLTRATCAETNLAVSVTARSERQFVLTVLATDKLPRSRRPFLVTVQSADTNDPPCRVTGMLHHPPELEILPDHLRFEPKTEPQMRIVWIKQHGGSPLQLVDVLPPSDHYRCEIDPEPGGVNYRIYVTAAELAAEAGRTNAVLLKLRGNTGGDRTERVPLIVDPRARKAGEPRESAMKISRR